MLDGGEGAVGALGEFLGVGLAGAKEVGVGDLPLAHFILIGRRDATAGGATRFLMEDVHAVVFPGEVEQAMGQVGNQGALVDDEAGEDVVALLFEWHGLPPGLARVGDDAGADREMGELFFDHAGGQQVELDAGGGVAGVGATVDLEHGGDRSGGVAQLVDDLGD